MRRMHRVILVVLGLLLVALPVPAALAQTPGEDMIFQRIVNVFPGSGDSINAMRANGMGWGAIIMVLDLAKLSSVEDILGRLAAGQGFGQIAQDLGIDPSELGQTVANVMSEGRSGGQASGTAGAVGREHSNGKGKP